MVDFKSTCEACGADLPEPDDKGFVRCEACGRVTQVPVAPPPPAPGAGDIEVDSGGFHISIKGGAAGSTFEVPTFAVPDATTTVSMPSASGARKGGCILAVVLALIGPVIAIIAIVGVHHTVNNALHDIGNSGDTGSSSSNVTVVGGTAVPLADVGAAGTTDIAAVVSDYTDATHRYVARLAVGPTKIRQLWRSDPEVPGDTTTLDVAVTGDTMFVGFDDNVWAISMATGKRMWKATVSDKVTYGCQECFSVVQGKLVVLSADADVTAFSPATPEPLWHQLLNSTQGNVQVLGNRLLILDDTAPHGQEATVRTVDPGTGRTLRQITPSCKQNPFDPNGERYIAGTGNLIHSVPGTDDLVMVFADGNGCVVRWNGRSNTVAWRTYLDGASSIEQDNVILSATDLVFTSSSNVMVDIDLATGKGKLLPQDPDTDAVPDRIVGKTLIADTTTTRGTQKGGLEAWGLVSGRKLWAVKTPQGAQHTSRGSYRESDALFDSEPRYVLVPATEGVRLVVFSGEKAGNLYSDQKLDLATGDLGIDKGGKYAYRSSGTPSMTVEGVRGRYLLVSMDSLLEAIPLGGGTILTFP